jgi:pimeloyl-ACP methyl ester carboxylesterase
MDGTGLLFKPFIEALSGDFAVRVVSYPGTDAFGYEELEGLARAALPMDGPFIILGESFSGPIAISLAASRPPGLVGLVLCSTFIRNPRPAFSFLRSVLGLVPVGLAPVRVLGHFLMGAHSNAQLRATLAESLAQVSALALRARLRAVFSVDVSSKLRSMDIPLLYLCATQDQLVPVSASKLIAQVYPGIQVVFIEAPHFLLQTAPRQAAGAVRTFVSALANGL